MKLTDLSRYDSMVFAIAECHRVDEAKDLRDKARAMEVYAQQAMNIEAERQATQIRLRAERRAGELLREMRRTSLSDAGAKGAAAQGKQAAATVAGASEYRSALNTAGVNERTAQRWQQLADVPAAQFEAALADPVERPTTNGMLAKERAATAAPARKMDDDALWLWGMFRDFERQRYADKDAAYLHDCMTETMRADVARILPIMCEWIDAYKKEVLP